MQISELSRVKTPKFHHIKEMPSCHQDPISPSWHFMAPQATAKISTPSMSTPALSSVAPGAGQVGKRARTINKACEPCRARKVQCDAAAIGLPCSSCRSRQCADDCVLPVRKSRTRFVVDQPNSLLFTDFLVRADVNGAQERRACFTDSQQCKSNMGSEHARFCYSLFFPCR